MSIIFTLIAGLISSSNVSARPNVTWGSLDCALLTPEHPNLGAVVCCKTETGKYGIEIRYCTNCDNTSPPSNCGPRWTAGSNPTGPNNGGSLGQSPLTPPKSNDGASTKGGDVGQPLTPPKSNDLNSPKGGVDTGQLSTATNGNSSIRSITP